MAEMPAHRQTRGTVSALPRHRRSLAEEISEVIARDLIFAGRVSTGRLLPSEQELAAQLGVSRPTIRESMLLLQHAGLLRIRHGVGSVVLPRPRTITHGLDRLCSIETFAHEPGKAVESVEVEWDEMNADAAVAAKLEIPVGHPVLRVRRVNLYDGARVGWVTDHVPEGAMSLAELRREFGGSTMDVLLGHPDLQAAEYADADISAVNLSSEVAKRLDVEPGRAAMSFDAVVCTVEGRPLDWAFGWYLPEHFRFAIRRRRQFGLSAAPVPEQAPAWRVSDA